MVFILQHREVETHVSLNRIRFVAHVTSTGVLFQTRWGGVGLGCRFSWQEWVGLIAKIGEQNFEQLCQLLHEAGSGKKGSAFQDVVSWGLLLRTCIRFP